MKPGDLVYPRSKGGLWLAATPVDGGVAPTNNQKRNMAGILYDEAMVLTTKTVTIQYRDLGNVYFTNCFVISKDGLLGWAGESALVKKE